MRQSWESPQTSASHHLLRKIIHTFPELQRGQQDPSEFLRCFLAELEKEVKEVKSTFSGWITHNTKCSNCQNESEQTNGFHDLSLAIPSSPKVTLEDCLQAQMKPREMSDVGNVKRYRMPARVQSFHWLLILCVFSCKGLEVKIMLPKKFSLRSPFPWLAWILIIGAWKRMRNIHLLVLFVITVNK